MVVRKRFGQHYLQPAWADRLVEVIAPRPAERFLEIGPGPGALTLRLAPRVEHLTAVEIDRGLAAALAPRLPANVDLVVADILDFDLAALLRRAPLRVAGNLPYNIASPILFRLIDAYKSDEDAGFSDATVMVQREVADRLAAAAGSREYGVLAISVQLYADVERLLTLPPGAFRPAPKVHSAVVRLTFRPPRVAIRDEELFDCMVRSMFTRRRKTLANALAPFAETVGADAREALAASAIDPMRRPETLHLEEVARLADAFAAARA
jgi:16S rRNA (adenine1518-N6/adenine1519-N6)-dimethyltransferase